jgi:glycosyltransferase involved in cell wall biosynthesis
MISYTITACNEHVELEKLLNFLSKRIKETDEIVLQLDETSVTSEVEDVATSYSKQLERFKVIKFPLNKDFSSFKNNLMSQCSNEWIFNIDADEIPAGTLIDSLHDIVSMNPDVDVVFVPRWNTVDGISSEHIKRWGWRFDELSRVNWPDWQMRLYRNKESIVWKNKVHEQLSGYETYSNLPDDKDFCLYHHKTINKQEQQNSFYQEIE